MLCLGSVPKEGRSSKHHGHKQFQRESEKSFQFAVLKLQTVGPCHTVPQLSVPFGENLSRVSLRGQTLVTVGMVLRVGCLPANLALDNITGQVEM